MTQCLIGCGWDSNAYIRSLINGLKFSQLRKVNMSLRKPKPPREITFRPINGLHENTNPNDIKTRLETAGGRIVCVRCSAKSKRTGMQCKAPAIRGKFKCKFHGGLSTGPRTQEGRNRCAQAKLVHGRETRQMRDNHREAMARLKLYAQILGVQWRMS